MAKSEKSDKLITSMNGSKDTTHVSFLCQECYQPLRIDNSLYSLDQELYKDLETSFPNLNNEEPIDNDCKGMEDIMKSSDVIRQIIQSKTSSGTGNGFALVGEAASGAKADNFSHRIKISAQLFDIMSGNTDIDHPLCEECTDSLLNKLDIQLHIAENELESYQDLLLTLQSQGEDEDPDLDEELRLLRLEEKELMEELANIEKEHKTLEDDKKEMLEEKERLTKEENKYWKEYSIHQQNLLNFEDEQNSVLNQLQYAQAQLDKLRKTNVFNSTFHIWHKGHFGTINNFRLGRLPSVPVEWNEINAAWGQTVLLLHSLAKKIGVKFKRYQLVPYGNHSYLECLDDKAKELPLYGSGGFRFFWDTKFDHAMVAFLDCLQQFKEEVEKGDSNFNLPYRMEKGKIYDSSENGVYSIRIQFNSEEHWTKALKYMLTNLKWGLAWVSSQFADKLT